MDEPTADKLVRILAALRQGIPVTPAGVDLRHAMERTLLALDAFRKESSAGSPEVGQACLSATKSAGRD